jgi:hypothetical protein
MVRTTKESTALSRLLSEERQRYLDQLRNEWRVCSATAHLDPDHQRTCTDCNGKICEQMQAKGVDEDGKPLPMQARPTCGAKTRMGGTCCHKVIPGKTRCRFHGGKSTGPRTPEGRARIAEAQRNRWAVKRKGDEC